MSPATSRQKRQSVTLPPEDGNTRDALQISPDPLNRPSGPASLLADPCFLPEAEFHEQPAAVVQVGRSISQQLTNHAEAVNSGIQRGSGLVISNLRLKVRCLGGRNIRRIGNDHVGGMFDSVEKVSGH